MINNYFVPQFSLLKVVKVSNATVHARSNISGSAKYELIIEVQQINYEIIGEFNMETTSLFHFRTYF